MTHTFSVTELSGILLEIARRPGSILFAGAGVGKRAGLPDWYEYVEFLATVADAYELETGTLMRKRAASSLLTHALELYKKCPLILEGEKFSKLGEPFSSGSYDAERLRALVALPFDSIVTTNFDRSLYDAYAKVYHCAPMSAELGDPSLKQAIYNWREFFIARVHGRVEVPRTMVLDVSDYQRTENDPDYVEFLVHILTRKICLFIGYSFVDPAMSRILEVVDLRVASGFPEAHAALLPRSAEQLANNTRGQTTVSC